MLLIAWRAIATGRGALYYVAAFFAIATQAVWSAAHLTLERLGTAVVVYAVFGVVATAVPIVARRMGASAAARVGRRGRAAREPRAAAVPLAGTVAPAALWALALLLAIMNAGLFIESAAGGLPLISSRGSLLSWVVLATWWLRAGAAVGVLPSLMVAVGLTLVTLAGHAWSLRSQLEALGRRSDAEASVSTRGSTSGSSGICSCCSSRSTATWSLPPWPCLARSP